MTLFSNYFTDESHTMSSVHSENRNHLLTSPTSQDACSKVQVVTSSVYVLESEQRGGTNAS